MIPRHLSTVLSDMRSQFPAIYLGGPRQAGKTTLLKALFSELPYVTLEDLDTQLLAKNDPRGFLSRYPNGAILDEVQRVPILFNYLQGVLDENEAFFALSGSQNYLLMEGITQSLAGRVGLLTLHPLCYSEIIDHGTLRPTQAILQGGYPRLIDSRIDRYQFFDSYIATYIERDVRALKNIGNLTSFKQFVRLCAARSGQQLNLSSLASDADISVNTAKSWLSILETSYLTFSLETYHKNFNKRVRKSPKLYFFDTGLVCHLLGIESEDQLRSSYLYGQIAETYLVAERYKLSTNRGRRPKMSYWRESNNHEIDLLEESSADLPLAFELKSAQTFHARFFDQLDTWRKITKAGPEMCNVVYFGEQEQETDRGKLRGWRSWLERQD